MDKSTEEEAGGDELLNCGTPDSHFTEEGGRDIAATDTHLR